MSFLERIGLKAPATAAASNQSAQNQSAQNQSDPQKAANNNPLANQGNNQQQSGQSASPAQAPKDPLAIFSKMYDNTTNAEAAPTFNLDSKQLSEVASSQKFTDNIDQALLQKAGTGDMQAMMEIMNSVGRNAYTAALSHGSRLTDTFVTAREAHSSKGFGKRVKSELINNNLSSTPNFSHPVVRKQLIQTAEALQAQYPDASPDEIKQMSMDYITELAGAINPQKPSAADTKNQPVNFDEWLDS